MPRLNVFTDCGLLLSVGLLLALARPAPAQTSAPSYYFSTLAGASSVGATDGVGADARFHQPTGVALDAAGNLYVTDSRNYTVRRITPAGVVSTVAGRAGSGSHLDGPVANARFRTLQGVAVDAAGNILVTENLSVRKISADGIVSTLAGYAGNDFPQFAPIDGPGSTARFTMLSGIAINSGGTVYVSDFGASQIRQITPTGMVTTVAGSGVRGSADGTGTGATFSLPAGLAVDAGGSLYVTEVDNHVLRRITPGGAVTTLAGQAGTRSAMDGVGAAATFNNPFGVAVDLAGVIYVADTYNQKIRKVTPGGQVTTLAGEGPADPASPLGGFPGATDGTGAAASFNFPRGMTTDASGNVYVADTNNNLIRKITSDGAVTTVAGLSPQDADGAVDAVGGAARFHQPGAVAVTPQGTCYVADTGNHTIRKIAPDGTVTTFAGAAGHAGYVDGPATDARFDSPAHLALDAAGNLYVLDHSRTVRKVTPAGVVSTLAGTTTVGFPGDGQGSTARFYSLTAIAVAPDGNIWVGESAGSFSANGFSNTWWARLRKVTPAGVVTTERTLDSVVEPHTRYTSLAFDAAGTLYACDPTYGKLCKVTPTGVETIRIENVLFPPGQVAVSASGQVFLTEGSGGYFRIARLGGGNQLEVIGGQLDYGHIDGVGTEARFSGISGLAIDAAGALYMATSDNTVRKGMVAGAPVITTPPRSQTVPAGASVQFSVAAAAVPAPAYQWYYNGNRIAGATAASYSFNAANGLDAGSYTVVVSNALGSVTSAAGVLTISGITTTPPPASGTGGSSPAGGGGAPSAWFLAMLAVWSGARWLGSRR